MRVASVYLYHEHAEVEDTCQDPPVRPQAATEEEVEVVPWMKSESQKKMTLLAIAMQVALLF